MAMVISNNYKVYVEHMAIKEYANAQQVGQAKDVIFNYA